MTRTPRQDAAWALRVAVHRCALGLAWSPEASPAPASDGLDLEHPPLPHPGTPAQAMRALLDGPAAAALRSQGVDPLSWVHLELRALEDRAVGPANGPLRRRDGAPSTLRAALPAPAGDALPDALVAWAGLERARTAARLEQAPALTRIAAATSAPLQARYETTEPISVRGDAEARLHLQIEPTTDGVWLYVVRREGGRGDTALHLALHVADGGVMERHLPADVPSLAWTSSRAPGPAPRAIAEVRTRP